METPFGLIIPAAGAGSRSGRDVPKQYVRLLGEPLLAHTLRAFAAIDTCVEIVIAIDEGWRTAAEESAAAAGVSARVRFVGGGSERQHSIAAGLAALSDETRLVLIHDAARPCVSRAVIDRVVAAAALHGAAIPAIPVADTIKRVDDGGRIVETIPRNHLRAAQTPQGFRTDLLRAAYARAAELGLVGTDDASLVEAAGGTVIVVEGAPENIKVTVAEDFERAERLLGSRS